MMPAGVGPISGMKDGDIVRSNEGEYGMVIDKVQDHTGRLIAQVQILNRSQGMVRLWRTKDMDARWRSSKRPA